MKRSGLLHAQLSYHLAQLGHTDTFVIGDSGLPIPRQIPVIDLALVPGIVDFRTVLSAVLDEAVIQRHLLAAETSSSAAHQWITEHADHLGEHVTISHEELKHRLRDCVFAIRTGERTPYANVILESGVPF